MKNLIENYLDFLVTFRRVQPSTHRLYRHHLALLLRAFQHESLKNLSAEKITRALELLGARSGDGEHELSAWTLDKIYDVWRAFLNWCVASGHLRSTPFLYLKPPIIRGARRPVASRETVLELLKIIEQDRGRPAAAAPVFQGSLSRGGLRLQPFPIGSRHRLIPLRDAAFFATLYFAGLRMNECCCLKLADLDFEAGFIRVVEGKGGTWRDVPIHCELKQRLQCWLKMRSHFLDITKTSSEFVYISLSGRGRPRENILKHVDGCRMGKILRERYIPAILGTIKEIQPGFTSHCLRHSFATRLLARGVPIDHVQELLGHRSIETTKIYAHYSPERLSADIARL